MGHSNAIERRFVQSSSKFFPPPFLWALCQMDTGDSNKKCSIWRAGWNSHSAYLHVRAPALLQRFCQRSCLLALRRRPIKVRFVRLPLLFLLLPRQTHVAVRPHLHRQRKFCTLPFALGSCTTEMELSRFHFSEPK